MVLTVDVAEAPANTEADAGLSEIEKSLLAVGVLKTHCCAAALPLHVSTASAEPETPKHFLLV